MKHILRKYHYKKWLHRKLKSVSENRFGITTLGWHLGWNQLIFRHFLIEKNYLLSKLCARFSKNPNTGRIDTKINIFPKSVFRNPHARRTLGLKIVDFHDFFVSNIQKMLENVVFFGLKESTQIKYPQCRVHSNPKHTEKNNFGTCF